MASNGKLEALAVLVAGGTSTKAAAERVGCGARTAYRIAGTERFKRRVADLRSEATAAAVGTLATAASQAAATLLALLDESQEPSIRLQASKAILSSVAPITELGELRARLDALEQRAG